MSVVSELNDRCRELTGGFIPDVADARKIIHHGSILVIQRQPDNLARHRVCLVGSLLQARTLRQLVEAEWNDCQ